MTFSVHRSLLFYGFTACFADKVYASVGLLVNVDNTWFLRGVLNRALPYVSPIVYTDVTAPPVLQWLAKTQDFVGMPTCGNVDLCQPLTPGLSLPGHMPWTVAVVVSGSSGVTAQGSGLLVHPGAVITGTLTVRRTGIM
ncbi:hypothetical protein ONE63_005016 [Megalurothrips usitatus]|uniref:Uncharacterized protein n=1 Tax=Megalurothrips usitatus TaxID=439358 RepID=A0AAV7X1J0_9NEOP|nr:hypothetical protein ONE63_005016 [Megalurothrips usitatus]